MDLEKDNDSYRSISGKYEEQIKTISGLRSKIVHHEESLSDLKSTIADRDRELHKQKDKLAAFDILKSRE